jgi:glycosyltransferase involved in cell wall biosynthesis
VALGYNKKIIISPRGELYPSALGIKPFQKKVWLRIIKTFQHKIFFHATNEYEKKLIGDMFPNSAGLEVIPNFIQLPKKNNIRVNTKQLLFIGRINPIKNIDVLLNSVAIIIRNHDQNIKLLIAGEAWLDYEKDYFIQLKKLIIKLNLQSNVTFLGHIDKEEKQKYIASSFALILPSKSENFGNVVIEALAQGTPVIASRNTPWEILETTETGYWVEAEPENIAAAVMRMHSLEAKDYTLMRERAYNLCIENFDISTNVHHWKNFYKKIIN